jgi:hypothetical protein
MRRQLKPQRESKKWDETAEGAHLPGFARVIGHIVSGQPELAEPYVQKKNCEKTG